MCPFECPLPFGENQGLWSSLDKDAAQPKPDIDDDDDGDDDDDDDDNADDDDDDTTRLAAMVETSMEDVTKVAFFKVTHGLNQSDIHLFKDKCGPTDIMMITITNE